MKKINSLRQLQREKERIKQYQEDLEDLICDNWYGLKENLKPVNIAKEVISKWIREKNEANLNTGSILKNTVTYGAALLASKLADRAGHKLGGLFKK